MAIDRRKLLAGLGGFMPATALAQNATMLPGAAFRFAFDGIEGGKLNLADHAGKVLLVVNTASSCGFTPQYADLQALHERFGSRGLVVIGIPSDDFAQERGSNKEIVEFCQGTFGVTFPLAAKQVVRGANAHPFYRWAASERPADIPTWNFHKFLIGRSGRIVGAFPARVRPTDTRIISLIEAQLSVS
ncbi:glutathione peroxidase [Phreatobacter aquaticus]|uniref:Glutathione peroxidase n=1 Tax=Phreatobacter aquaticus TaxID=2570229 RepID=A0A4D7QPH5_9HYPH|nr:glutathione peroxidase [Phreatobacter aquaticus]QCK87164.1 glutathione peroxidase [Phreatobacter aquaticus]